MTQLYSMRYGTIPVVHNTGGLADTIVNATEVNLKNKTATGFYLKKPEVKDFLQASHRAITLYRSSAKWQDLMRTAMQQEFSWASSAKYYEDLYKQSITQ